MRRPIDSMSWTRASKVCKATGEANPADMIVALADATSQLAFR